MACAHEIAASTAQLTVASKVCMCVQDVCFRLDMFCIVPADFAILKYMDPLVHNCVRPTDYCDL